MKITQWVIDGNVGLARQGITTEDELIEAAGRLLDKSCSGDIVGEILFRADNGKFYVGNVEFVISEASPEYVADAMRESESDDEAFDHAEDDKKETP